MTTFAPVLLTAVVALANRRSRLLSGPECDSNRERGAARLREAIELLKREAMVVGPEDPRPRWGLAFAYSGLADYYLAMMPPQHEKAAEAAHAALKLRPDFWYVKQRVLPRLGK